MNSNVDVTCEAVNIFGSDKCFICFISDCPHYIWWNLITILKYEHIIAPHVLSTSIFTRIVQTVLCSSWNQHNTVCTILVKIDALHTCGAMICSYFGIVFLLHLKRYRMLFTHLSKITCSCSLMDWFLTSWTCLLNLNEYHLATLIRSVNDWRFWWLRNVFVNPFQGWLNSFQ